MLTEFQLIRNIGKFDNCSGSPSLKKITLVYSENARGKTTLAAILRSISENHPSHITARQRLGTTNQPHIRLASSQGDHVFQNGAWNTDYPNMVIFDDHFVEVNVYSGLAIGREQCNGLHEVILGARGVSLAHEIERIIGQITEVNGRLRRAQTALQSHTGGLPVDDFIALTAIDDAPQQIRTNEALLGQIRQAEPIRQQRAFEEVQIPAFQQAALETILSHALANVEQDAIAAVERHVRSLGPDAEQWVQVGVTLARDRTACPFCDQDTQGTPLLDAYRMYFSREYEEHVRQIAAQTAGLLQSLISLVGSLGHAPAVTEARRTFWAQYMPDLPPVPAFDDMADCAQALHDQLCQVFQQKRESPLAVVETPRPLLNALDAYTTMRDALLHQQQSLLAQNQQIQQIKANAQAGSRSQVEAELARLRGALARHSDPIVPLVDAVQDCRRQKTDLETRRDDKRDELNCQRQASFPQYQEAVNRYLGCFRADFQIVDVSADNLGTSPSVQYALKINNEVVGTDAFKHTLSAGDRSALALAFFFAHLDGRQGLAETVVVFDDPFTSMDDHRSSASVQTIRSLHERIDQLIVLSHDPIFLWRIQEQGVPSNDLACMQVVTDGGWTKSKLAVWNIAEVEVTIYDSNHARLRKFSREGTGSPQEIASLLRQVMEYFCRVAFPEHYPPGKMLGVFREDERARQDSGNGLLDVHDFQELQDITEYANKFHHSTNANYDRELRDVNENELKGYADRVLEFTRYRRAAAN